MKHNFYIQYIKMQHKLLFLAAPPPLLPPKDNRSERIQNPPASVKPPTQTGGGFAIDPSQIANSKNRLKKVAEDKTNLENQATKTSPKDYADATNFSELQQKFKGKVDGKPGKNGVIIFSLQWSQK